MKMGMKRMGSILLFLRDLLNGPMFLVAQIVLLLGGILLTIVAVKATRFNNTGRPIGKVLMLIGIWWFCFLNICYFLEFWFNIWYHFARLCNIDFNWLYTMVAFDWIPLVLTVVGLIICLSSPPKEIEEKRQAMAKERKETTNQTNNLLD